MFCENCGTKLAEGSLYCPNCGHKVMYNSDQKQKPETADKTPITPAYEQPAYQQRYQYGSAYDQAEPAFSMKWYKFVIYAQLFLTALSLLGSGIMMITGLHYGGYADHVYNVYGAMKIIDIGFGIFSLVLIPFVIITRQKLARFKADGPRFLMIIVIAVLAINVLYAVSAAVITGINTFEATVIGTIIGDVALIIGNHIYFQKRKELFFN